MLRSLTTIALCGLLASPAAAQHPYLQPDFTAHAIHAASADVDDVAPDLVIRDAQVDAQMAAPDRDLAARNLAPHPLFWVKVASSIAVVDGSRRDFQASARGIAEGRIAEGNGAIRNRDGTVDGKRKALATGLEQLGSWALYARGRRWLAIAADAGAAVVFYFLARRADRLGTALPQGR